MVKINEIINFKDHPIDNFDYINKCKYKISHESVLVLENFLTDECLNELIAEALKLQDKAFYCSQNHTIFLDKYDENIGDKDPLNIEVKSDKGCVPHDYLDSKSKLNILYDSQIFKNFLKKILNLNNLFPYADSLSSINYNYYQNKQQLGWHFDNASFAITLMIQASDTGGEFQYVNKGRNYNKSYIDKNYIKKILDNSINPKTIKSKPGTLILFYGRNYLHRVTPVTSKKSRILVTLNYNEEEGRLLSENARLTFFGRIN